MLVDFDGAEVGVPLKESVGNRIMRIYPTTRPSVQDIIIRHAHADESDLCRTGKRQSPINIELDVVNKKLPVISWRITNAAEAKFRRMSAGSGASEMLIREGDWKMVWNCAFLFSMMI